MDDSRIAFHGTLGHLLKKVESGEMIPKLQASHAPPCKFWTAFQVLNGIRHVAPVIHGPKGCTYSVASSYKMRGCEYRGVPWSPPPAPRRTRPTWSTGARASFSKRSGRPTEGTIPS